MALATVDADGAPVARMVLLKGADERGLRFFTNYESRKAHELEENPRAAVILYWPTRHRQIRAIGPVEKVSPEESDEYWQTRPRGSQIAAWASDQSRPLDSRDALEERFAELEREYKDRDVPRPPHWGGYLLRPEEWEFWEGRRDRLHDRRRLRRAPDGTWSEELLAP
jgi:pyridoxamine 5'-phosphate oxidase